MMGDAELASEFLEWLHEGESELDAFHEHYLVELKDGRGYYCKTCLQLYDREGKAV